MWHMCAYAPVSFYSLKLSAATSSGGKTLLAPTPYALKMALLDVAYRRHGIDGARELWPAIRDLQIAYSPPQRAVVNNVFTRVLKPSRNPTPGTGPFSRTIAYREYVQFSGPLSLALAALDAQGLGWLAPLLAGITYLGKRGGFVQLTRPPQTELSLPNQWVRLNPPESQPFNPAGLLQVLDDCGPTMTIEQASVYSAKRVRLGQERLQHHVVLPYRPVRASKAYTLYERCD